MSDRLANATVLPDRAVPTRVGNLVFEGKAALLRLRRSGRELADPVKRHRAGQTLADAPVLAKVTSPLWTTNGGAKDRALNAGRSRICAPQSPDSTGSRSAQARC